MSASRAILLPTGMAMTFSIGRPVTVMDPECPHHEVELQPEPRSNRVIALRDGKPVEDEG